MSLFFSNITQIYIELRKLHIFEENTYLSPNNEIMKKMSITFREQLLKSRLIKLPY